MSKRAHPDQVGNDWNEWLPRQKKAFTEDDRLAHAWQDYFPEPAALKPVDHRPVVQGSQVRMSDHGVPVRINYNWETMINLLDDRTVRQLLIQTAYHPNYLHASIIGCYNAAIENEDARRRWENTQALEFDRHLKAVWDEFGGKYPGCPRFAFDAVQEVEKTANTITLEVKRESSLGTKRNAILALCKIANRAINSGDSRFGRDVRYKFRGETCLEQGMEKILDGMNSEEIRHIAEVPDGQICLLNKFQDLEQEAAKYGMFEGLERVIRRLLGGSPDESESSSNDSESDENESCNDANNGEQEPGT